MQEGHDEKRTATGEPESDAHVTMSCGESTNSRRLPKTGQSVQRRSAHGDTPFPSSRLPLTQIENNSSCRASPGAHLQIPPPVPQGPPYIARAPQPQMRMMAHHAPAIYPSPYGYWYQPDYQYQQAMMSPQVLQNYYAQMYGLASPAAPPPYQQYVGYVPTPTPRAMLPSAPQVAGQPFMPHPTAQIQQGSFIQVPSLPHNFRLQLPHHDVSMLPPNATDLQSADQASSAAGEINANNTPCA